jgi:site-specific recombinase XerD
MLYETAARASEILGLNVEDLDLEQRRAAVRSKGGDTEFVYWDRAPAAPAAAPARRHLTRQRAAVPGQPQASPRAPPRAP